MDFINRVTGQTSSLNVEALLKFSDIDPRVQKHLSKVYATLTLALAVCAAGVAADVAWSLSGVLMTIAAFGSLLWLSFTPATPANLNKRLGLLLAFAFAQGTTLGPLVSLALAVSPGVLLTTALSTAAIFGSFTLSALFTRRRSYLFLGGLLSSAVSAMLVMRLGGWLFGLGRFAFEAELYLGLLVFSGYVLVDTQMVVERASAGDSDYIGASLDLFVDFIAIAVRILIILLRNAQKREERERRRRRDD